MSFSSNPSRPQNIDCEQIIKKLANVAPESFQNLRNLDEESFEVLAELNEKHLNIESSSQDLKKKQQPTIFASSFRTEEAKYEENYKLDKTLQSEYEPNLKSNDFSIDSPRNYIRDILDTPSKNQEISHDKILDDLSIDKESDISCRQINQKTNEILKRSEIQILQSKREEALNKPIYLNIMIVGASSLGKTTFIDVFLSNKFEKVNKIRPPTNDIFETTAKIRYEKFHFFLKMIDTPGFTHSTNIQKYYKILKKNITDRFCKYKKSQLKKEKKEYFLNQNQKAAKETIDERIHLCLYFASAPRINNHDIFLMKKLQKFCNVIPIIAKGDCFTPEEIKEIKLEFNKVTSENGIEFFDCVNAIDNAEKAEMLTNGPFGPCPPFLIITSLERIEIQPNKFSYCRKYNWGICDVENPLHCDFTLLYKLLIGYFSLELINLTDFFYKAYLNHKQEKKKKLRESQQKYKIGFGIMTFILGAIYFKKNVN